MVGERPKPFGEALGFDPITSTLIFGEYDAVLVDAMGTVAEALADWVALHKRNLETIYIRTRALTPWSSLLRGVCRSGVRLAEIGKIRAHQPLIGRHPIAEGRVRGQRENHVHHVVAEAAAVEGGKAE
jgi:hypothetical protein